MLKIGNRMVDYEGEGFVNGDHEVSVDIVEDTDGHMVELNVQCREEDVSTTSKMTPDSARYLGIVLIEAALLSDLKFSPGSELEEVHSQVPPAKEGGLWQDA